jgi:Mitochondrial degradasome RNA helicase subunit C terminal
MSMTSLYHFAATYAMRKPVALNVRLSRVKPRDVLELSDLCLKHNVLDLYLWLSLRYPEFFVERELCQEQKSFAIECIQESLESSHLQHRFSHSNEYKAMRIRFLTGKSQGMPSLSYGAVRSSFEENIALISECDLYTFPTMIEEDGGKAPPVSFRDREDNGRKAKLMGGGKSLPIGLVASPDVKHSKVGLIGGSDRTAAVGNTAQQPARTAIHLQYSTPKSNLVYNKTTKQYEKPSVKPPAARAVGVATGSKTSGNSHTNEKQVKQHFSPKNAVHRPLNSLTKLPLINTWHGNKGSNSNNNNKSSSSSDRGTHPGAVKRTGTQSQSQSKTPGNAPARTGTGISNQIKRVDKVDNSWDKLLNQNEL